MPETWLPCPGYPGYEVSDRGNVRSYRRRGAGHKTLAPEPKLLKPTYAKYGYPQFSLSVDGKYKCAQAHRLVATAFLPGYFEGAWVLHQDGDPTNNNVANLRWGSAKDNHLDRYRGKSGLTRTRSQDNIRAIRDAYATGLTQVEVARKFHTSQQYVSNLVTRNSRKDVI